MSRAPVNRGCTTRRSPVERSITISLARRQARWSHAPTSRRFRAGPVMPRSTSARLRRTLVIRSPLISRSRSRAMVSVSGSSGTPVELSPTDIRSVLLARELHAAGVVLAAAAGIWHRVTDASDGQDATAVGDERAVLVGLRAGVEDQDIVWQVRG